MTAALVLEGQAYAIARAFGEARALIDYGGVYVFVDRDDAGTWSLSGDPPRNQEEHDALAELVAPQLDKTEVTVTEDDP